jgi:hypothetical protein
MQVFIEGIGLLFLAMLVLIGAATISAIPIWIFWNDLMPFLFSLKQVTFLQAFEISLLAACLFKSTSISKS